jgi:GntR family transcriptional regulator, carbon starvation induced regulator
MEDVHEVVRSDILFGRRPPGTRLQLNELAEATGVSLSVVREAVTRLASEGLVEATPQQGFRVRSLSLADLRDLTWVRVQFETLALRESIARGDVTWEANLVAAHYRLAVTPVYLDQETGNPDWMAAHGGFHAALTAAAGSPILERVRRQLYDASELYRYWSATLPHHPIRTDAADEHKAIFEAALARDADRATQLLADHLEMTARSLEEVASPAEDSDEDAAGLTVVER